MELCACLTIAPELTRDAEPITYLKVFSRRVRVGVLASNISGVSKCTMGGYLRDVVQIFYGMGIITRTWINWSASTFSLFDNPMCKNVTTRPLPTCDQ